MVVVYMEIVGIILIDAFGAKSDNNSVVVLVLY